MKKIINTLVFILALTVFVQAQNSVDKYKESKSLQEKEKANGITPSQKPQIQQVQKEEQKKGDNINRMSKDDDDAATAAQRQKEKAEAGKDGSREKKEADVFDMFKVYFIDGLWKTYPGWATAQGFHRYDAQLVIPDANSHKKELAFCSHIKDSLKHYDFETLTPNSKMDYRLIENFLNGVQFNVKEFKSYEWDPSNYNIGGAIFDVLDYQHISLEEKLRNLNKKLALVPMYYKAAEKNIVHPTKEHTQLAIDQNNGSLYLFEKVLVDSLAKSKLSKTEQTDFAATAKSARAAVEEYVVYLKKLQTTEKEFRSFRIGKELYEKKFALDINSQYSAEAMMKKATERKDFVQGEMFKITQKLWSTYLGNTKMPEAKLVAIKMLIDELSTKHCKREDLLSTIENQLPELTKFINEKQLIDLDPTKPLKVRKTPEYLAGVAGASINSPGPYDQGAATYYNVTPLTNYTDAEAESYLREYNNYVLPILNIHEAIPGHYTQGIYANRSASLIKTVLGNGATVEGWACYAERMMIEEGYKDSPEMLLFYYKWNLREACNFILDYNVHCNNWTEKEVNNLLVNEAFQQEKEAKEKYKRATLSQVQLTSYFTGLTEIYELREDLKKKLDKRFDLKKFNERFLSFGSAPVKEIRGVLLKN